MSNARIQFSLASEDVWNAYNPQLKEGEIVTVLKANKKVKLVQGKVGNSMYSESTVIWDEDEAQIIMSRSEAAASTSTTQAAAASGSASKAAASQSAAAMSATNAKASENAAKTSETNAKSSETAARNSATAAAASAITASDKASEAATSATNAAVSATSAAGAAEEAQGLISKAEYGFLERNKKYAVGDIAYTTQLPAGYYLECVTAGTTGNTEPTISVESENVNDGTVKWGVKNIQDASKLGLPVGFEAFTINPNLQAGWLPLLGGEYSRTAYADLWAWVQTQQGYLIEESAWQDKATANGGNVPFYSKGDGSTTFRVPALKCWVKGASNISEVGGYLVAGLPNIDTNVYIGQDGSGYPNGSADSTTVGSTASYPRKTKLFRASDYNTIYGTSDTVQPPSIVGLWVVKAYGVVTNVGSTDVANISTGLAQAETRISSLETNKVDKAGNAWVVESYRNDTQWYRVWSDGWIEQGGNPKNSLWGSSTTINFFKPFADTNYIIVAGTRAADGETQCGGTATFSRTKTTTSIVIVVNNWSNNYKGVYGEWYACGMGA